MRAETLGKGFQDSVTDMQGRAASRSHKVRSDSPGIVGRDKRQNDGVIEGGEGDIHGGVCLCGCVFAYTMVYE